jgi:hypothetical protein
VRWSAAACRRRGRQQQLAELVGYDAPSSSRWSSSVLAGRGNRRPEEDLGDPPSRPAGHRTILGHARDTESEFDTAPRTVGVRTRTDRSDTMAPGRYRLFLWAAGWLGSSRTSGRHRCKRPLRQGRLAQRRRCIHRAARAAPGDGRCHRELPLRLGRLAPRRSSIQRKAREDPEPPATARELPFHLGRAGAASTAQPRMLEFVHRSIT